MQSQVWKECGVVRAREKAGGLGAAHGGVATRAAAPSFYGDRRSWTEDRGIKAESQERMF